MSEKNGMAPDLTPEQRERVLKADAEMKRRIREGNFAPRPRIPEKMDSMAPGFDVVQRADGPPIPFPTADEPEEK